MKQWLSIKLPLHIIEIRMRPVFCPYRTISQYCGTKKQNEVVVSFSLWIRLDLLTQPDEALVYLFIETRAATIS